MMEELAGRNRGCGCKGERGEYESEVICMIQQCGSGHNCPNRNLLQLSKGPASIILGQHMSV